MPNVKDAKVNFSAAKLWVDGTPSIHDLEKAGAFENLKLTSVGNDLTDDTPTWNTRKNLLVIIASMFVIFGWVTVFTHGEHHPLTIGLFLTGMVIGGYRLFLQGIKNLLQLEFDMKTLMTIAIIGAAIIGEWGEGAVVVILFAISEALEVYSMERARKSIRSLIDATPKEAIVFTSEGEKKLPLSDVHVGDEILVKPGTKIALDGIVVKGFSAVNQAPITGESIPVSKGAGDEVFAGTINEEGILHVKVTKHIKDTTIAKIIYLVEEAQNKRAPAQKFIDRFAKYYTPFIMLLALLVAVFPPLAMGASWEEWIYLGLATLVVGCPCALVISTPVAVVTAISNSAKNGVLIKGGVFLEQAGKLDTIAFDKTGTLTKGIPIVTDIEGNGREKEVLELAYAVEKYSNHPLAKAIVRKAEEQEITIQAKVEYAESLTGKGMCAVVNGTLIYAASPAYLKSQYTNLYTDDWEFIATRFQMEGKTAIVIGSEEVIYGIIAVRDEVRQESTGIIQSLQELGIQNTVMLTGDNATTAQAIGSSVGVSEVIAELLPDEKLKEITRLKEQQGGKVAMVGDGMNDAPALAAADLGIAMGSVGTDTALETADIALMGDDLKKLPYLIGLSRKTLRIIKQNILFSLGIKALALLLVPFGWLTLWIAIFADMGATLLVTLNSLRLIKVKDK